MNIRQSYAFRFPETGIVINLLLLLAMGLLFIGLTAPILTLEKFHYFSNTVSLVSAIRQLWLEQEWGLMLLVGGFSVVFPVLKILLLLAIWNLEASNTRRHSRHLKWLAAYSKWSMLDVFVVALLVVSVKLDTLAEANVEYGIYAFALSVILTMLVSSWIGLYTRESGKPVDSQTS